MVSHGSELTSPYVTKETRCFDMHFPTPIFPETRPGRICATALRMAELAETCADHIVYGVNAEGVGGLGVGLRTPSALDHTNVPILIIIMKPFLKLFHSTVFVQILAFKIVSVVEL